jgi:hypothetical protein
MSQTFFGFQIALPGDALRQRFHEVIGPGGVDPAVDLGTKRVFYDRVVELLRESAGAIQLGYWDYIADPGRAPEEFDEWCSGIEATSRGAPEPRRGAMFLVSLVFLVEAGSNSDQTIGERCDLPESDYFTRATFARLIDTVPMLSYSSVRADAAYMVPGTSPHGLALDVLQGEGWDYLKPIR